MNTLKIEKIRYRQTFRVKRFRQLAAGNASDENVFMGDHSAMVKLCSRLREDHVITPNHRIVHFHSME